MQNLVLITSRREQSCDAVFYRVIKRFLCVGCLLLFTACSEPQTPSSEAESTPVRPETDKTSAVKNRPLSDLEKHFRKLGKKQHDIVIKKVKNLNDKLFRFTGAPSPAKLDEAKTSWIDFHQAFHHYLVLLSLPPTQQALNQTVPNSIHSWQVRVATAPILGGYLDSVKGYEAGGLIYAQDLQIDLPTLDNQHQYADRYYGALGIHALEFMLWGDPLIDKNERAPTFDGISEAKADERQPKIRRSRYLRLLGETLLTDMLWLETLWSDNGIWEIKQKSPQPEDSNDRNRSIAAVVEGILLPPLAEREDEPGVQYQIHGDYSRNYSSFWEGRISGVWDILETAGLATRQKKETEDLPTLNDKNSKKNKNKKPKSQSPTELMQSAAKCLTDLKRPDESQITDCRERVKILSKAIFPKAPAE